MHSAMILTGVAGREGVLRGGQGRLLGNTEGSSHGGIAETKAAWAGVLAAPWVAGAWPAGLYVGKRQLRVEGPLGLDRAHATHG